MFERLCLLVLVAFLVCLEAWLTPLNLAANEITHLDTRKIAVTGESAIRKICSARTVPTNTRTENMYKSRLLI
jgi:hypothetical protein